jgi:hypothetical protein
MGTAAKPTRKNRTITVDFQNEATYFRLMGDGKAFLESVLAFILSALSTYCVQRRSSGNKVYTPMGLGFLCCCSSSDFVPDLESLSHFLAIRGGREQVTSRSEVLGNGSIRRKKALGMSLRLKSLHAPLPLAGRLLGVFGAVVEIAMVVLHPR